VNRCHVLDRAQARNQVVELEHEADVLAAELRQLRLVGAIQPVVAVPDFPAAGYVQPAEDVEQRGLATAGGTQQHHELAAVQGQVDAAQRVHLDVAHPVHLGQAAGAEYRRIGGRCCRHGRRWRGFDRGHGHPSVRRNGAQAWPGDADLEPR